jgi:photosystem II stability/assembly factor-like uncharacterized protein
VRQLLYLGISIALLSSSCKKDNTYDTTPVDQYAWIVGHQDTTGYGTILLTRDGGLSFERQGLGQAALMGVDVLDVFAISKSNVWAVGTNNSILKTTDGGATWQSVAAPQSTIPTELYSISIINQNTIYISGSFGMVYKSTDGGAQWSLCDTTGFNQALIQGIHAITPDRVFLAGGVMDDNGDLRGFIRYTENGGASWDSVTLADDFNRHEWISPVSYGNTIIIHGATNYYTVSRDNGITWQNDSTAVAGGTNGGADINHLIMLGENNWWAAMDMGHLIRTTNGGQTWSDPTTGLGGAFMLGIDAYNNNIALSVGETTSFPRFGPISRTTDGGQSWTKVYTHGSALYKVSFAK